MYPEIGGLLIDHVRLRNELAGTAGVQAAFARR